MLISNDRTCVALAKRELETLAECMHDPERPSLDCLWLDPGRGRAYTSDGHRAIMVECGPRNEGPPTPPVAVPGETIRELLKSMGVRDWVGFDVADQTEVYVTVRERRPRHDEPETYDDFEGAMRDKKPSTVVRAVWDPMSWSPETFFPSYKSREGKGRAVLFNPALLNKPMRLFGRLGVDVWISAPRRDQEPILFVGEVGTSVWRMVLMPMRNSGHPDGKRPSAPKCRPLE